MSGTCGTQEGREKYIAPKTARVGLRCRWLGMGILIRPLSYLSALLHLLSCFAWNAKMIICRKICKGCRWELS
jgi:hypothetical protein